MNNLSTCENCQNHFDEEDHIPMILPCSHPLCKKCLELFIKNKTNKCQKCNKEINIAKKTIKDFNPHLLILELLRSAKNFEVDTSSSGLTERTNDNRGSLGDSSSLVNTMMNSSDQGDKCIKHKPKYIEYFCQTCTLAVCVTCIYQSHNGHHLTVLEEMSGIIKLNIQDFSKMLKNIHKVNDENATNAITRIDELMKLKETQINIVTKIFDDINKKLEEKKIELKKEFEKYK